MKRNGYDIMDMIEKKEACLSEHIPCGRPYENIWFNPDDYRIVFSLDVCSETDTEGIAPAVNKAAERVLYLFESCREIKESSPLLLSAYPTSYTIEHGWKPLDVFENHMLICNAVRMNFGINLSRTSCPDVMNFIIKLEKAVIRLTEFRPIYFSVITVHLSSYGTYTASELKVFTGQTLEAKVNYVAGILLKKDSAISSTLRMLDDIREFCSSVMSRFVPDDEIGDILRNVSCIRRIWR